MFPILTLKKHNLVTGAIVSYCKVSALSYKILSSFLRPKNEININAIMKIITKIGIPNVRNFEDLMGSSFSFSYSRLLKSEKEGASDTSLLLFYF